MAAYLVARLDVTDADAYATYRQGVGATIAQYGGRFLVRGGAVSVLEGQGPGRVVILEFESSTQLMTWWDSPEYRPLRELRQRASTGDIFMVEGV